MDPKCFFIANNNEVLWKKLRCLVYCFIGTISYLFLSKSKYYWKGTSFCNSSVVIEKNEKVREGRREGRLPGRALGFAADSIPWLSAGSISKL